MIKITLNGEKKTLEQSITISELVKRFEIDLKKTAIEKNNSIIPKSKHHLIKVRDADIISCFEFVGGG